MAVLNEYCVPWALQHVTGRERSPAGRDAVVRQSKALLSGWRD